MLACGTGSGARRPARGRAGMRPPTAWLRSPGPRGRTLSVGWAAGFRRHRHPSLGSRVRRAEVDAPFLHDRYHYITGEAACRYSQEIPCFRVPPAWSALERPPGSGAVRFGLSALRIGARGVSGRRGRLPPRVGSSWSGPGGVREPRGRAAVPASSAVAHGDEVRLTGRRSSDGGFDDGQGGS
jgi:hypothetical protein